MAKGLNLRAIFSADTKGIESGAKRATQSIKTFDKESSKLLENFGSIVGINTAQIGKMSQAIEGFGVKTATSAGKSEASIKKISGAFKVLGGIIGGVAAVGVALWKALSSEAEYYGTQLSGLGHNAGLEAYKDTLKQLRHEHRDGAAIQEFVNRIKRGWASIGNFVQSLFNPNANFQEDKSKAQQAYNLGVIDTNISVQELNNRKKVAEIDAEIAEKRRQMNDTELTYIQRQAAAASLQDLVNQKAFLESDILEKRLANMKALHALAGETLEDRQAETDLEVQIYNIQKNKEMELRSIQKQQRTLSKETEGWLKSIEQMAEEESIAQLELDIEVNDAKLDEELTSTLNEAQAEFEEIVAGWQPIEIKVDQRPLVKTIDLLPVLEQGFKQTFENIGTYIGNGLSGGGWAADELASMMLSTLGDMAIKVGELAISTGVALSGIQASLNSMNPYLAIAAGAALVALGSAVKAGAANIANGGGYSSASVSSSYGSYSGDNYATREISVNVTGTLVANGSQLVAVLNNENKRKSLTT